MKIGPYEKYPLKFNKLTLQRFWGWTKRFLIKFEIKHFLLRFLVIHLFQIRDQSWFSSSFGCIATTFSLEFSVRTTGCFLKSCLEIILFFHFLQSWRSPKWAMFESWKLESFRVHSSKVSPSVAWLHALIVRYPASEW